MPSVQLRWWNLAGGGLAKANAATALLNGWGGAPGPAAGVAWAAAPAPGAASLLATCEVNGNLFVVPTGLGGGLAIADASPTAGHWVAAKWRINPASRNAQKGYYGDNPVPPLPLPTRYDVGNPGAWAPLLQTAWGNYPGNLGLAPFIVNRPNAIAVRNRATRRELVVGWVGPVMIAWYHAISGQGAATIYDIYEVLDWVIAVANQPGLFGGAPRHVVVIGDLNLTPALFNNFFAAALGGVGLGFAGLGSAGPIAPNQYAIIHTATSTHSGGHELDYAVVMNLDPTGAPGAAAIGGFIECGVLAGGPALGGPAPPGFAGFGPLVFGAHQTDHRPIKFQIDY
jgi:hypothetical protein